MVVRELAPGVSSVGAIDWERRLFDSLIPLPDGTSYNSYLVRGSDKTALIDTVDPLMEFELVKNLVEAKTERVDYLVVNHAEQDHSGTVPMIAELFPAAKVVCSEKCKEILPALLDIDPERIIAVKDGDTMDLGGKTLEFIMAPWVHWPETMLTYLKEDHILFSCDLFGSHYAMSELFSDGAAIRETASKRYFAEIMMPFRGSIRTYLDRISAMGPEVIAPSHGPCLKPTAAIIDAYRGWTSDEVKNEVVILYVSMHGSTEKMVHHLAGALMAKGIGVRVFPLTSSDIGLIATSLVDAATVVIGTPTVLFGPHPLAANIAFIANALKPKTKFLSVVGSYGWGGKTLDQLTGMLTHVKAEVIEPVMVRGAPGAKEFQAIERLAANIAEKHASIGIR